MSDILKYGQVLGRGVVGIFGPSVLKGVVVELFREKKVDVKMATEWVLANNSLWDSLEPERQRQFKQLASKMGDMNFITTEWVIDALREDFPAVASLFLGWEKGRNWLARQVERIKAEL